MTYVGQVYVRVSPDTKQFDAAIARREKKRHKTVFEALLDTAEAEARRKGRVRGKSRPQFGQT